MYNNLWKLLENFIGYFAAFCTTTAFVPQVIKVYKTRRTKDISLGMFFLMSAGVGSWLIYGLMLKSLPIITANGITLFLASYIFVMKMKFDSNN